MISMYGQARRDSKTLEMGWVCVIGLFVISWERRQTLESKRGGHKFTAWHCDSEFSLEQELDCKRNVYMCHAKMVVETIALESFVCTAIQVDYQKRPSSCVVCPSLTIMSTCNCTMTSVRTSSSTVPDAPHSIFPYLLLSPMPII